MANHISHAALPYCVKNARYTIPLSYLDADGDPTDPTTPDTEISKDGAAFADCAEEASTITGSNGSAYITLTGAETDCSLVKVAAKVASGPKATLVDIKPRVLATIFSGTAQAGAAGSITLATDIPNIADLLIGCIVKTTGGTGGGGTGGANNQARVITDFSTGRVATVEPNWETAPDGTTTYEIKLTEQAILRFADVKLWNTSATIGTPQTGDCYARLGAPAGASVSADVAAIKTDTGSLEGKLTSARAGYLDKLNITGNVASSGEVTAIQNNTNVRVIVPGMLERPDSGSTLYTLDLYLYDEAGNMEAPDSTPTITAKNEAGTDRSANLSAVSNPSTGVYTVTYTVSSSHLIEQIRFEWSIVEGGVTRKHGASTQIVDTTAVDFTSADRTKLDTLHDTRIPGVIQPQTGDAFARLATYRLGEILSAAKTGQPTANSFLKDLTEDDGGTQRFTANALEQAPGGAGATPQVLVDTTVASLTSQTVFRLTAGPTIDDALNSQTIVLYDVSGANDPSVRKILDYAGATKEVTIDGAPDFTFVAGDGVKVFVAPAGATAPTESQVADKVLDELAKQKVTINRATGQIKHFKPDETTVRGTLQQTEISADEVGYVSV